MRECREFAEKNNITIIDECVDRAISGKTDNRPGFQRLIKDSEKRKFDAAIMYTPDRFARNRYDSAIYKARLKKKIDTAEDGTLIVTVDGNTGE